MRSDLARSAGGCVTPPERCHEGSRRAAAYRAACRSAATSAWSRPLRAAMVASSIWVRRSMSPLVRGPPALRIRRGLSQDRYREQSGITPCASSSRELGAGPSRRGSGIRQPPRCTTRRKGSASLTPCAHRRRGLATPSGNRLCAGWSRRLRARSRSRVEGRWIRSRRSRGSARLPLRGGSESSSGVAFPNALEYGLSGDRCDLPGTHFGKPPLRFGLPLSIDLGLGLI